MSVETVDALITPKGHLDILSRAEVSKLQDTNRGGLYRLFRNCSLAVLSSDSRTDDGKALLARYRDFDIRVLQNERGIRLQLRGAPASAFVDGEIIRGISEHLFAVLRDIVYVGDEIANNARIDLDTSEGVTDAVFHVLRNAGVLQTGIEPRLVVCWGGHSISRTEYDYTKQVGYELGLRGLNICTGCGPGAMKGPMKGATIGHAKQRFRHGRYLGVTEPGIIAAEAPNPIVNELVILPDIEKRLEAFLRLGHGIVVFPGGVGTAEEILYLLGILLHPDNAELPFPVVFTGPAGAAGYFEQINDFIGRTLGPAAQTRYTIIMDDPVAVARHIKAGIAAVKAYRQETDDAFYFNWRLRIDHAFQRPFRPTHDNMRALQIHREQPPHQLAAHLRRLFSGIVAGNVKEEGITAIERHGPFEIRGERDIMDALDALLRAFVEQQRMKLPGTAYRPCYRLVR